MEDNTDIYIYGASGHGKVIYECLEALGVRIRSFVDDDLSKKYFLNEPVSRFISHEFKRRKEVVFGIGNNQIRKKLAKNYTKFTKAIIHPSAIVSSRTEIEEGTVVLHRAVIQAGTKIGKHCIVNTAAVVDHDCQLADFVHISPNATLCGNVSVGECSWIGAGSTIIQGVHIGKNSIVGAGSLIRTDVPDNVVIAGNPARIIRNNPAV